MNADKLEIIATLKTVNDTLQSQINYTKSQQAPTVIEHWQREAIKSAETLTSVINAADQLGVFNTPDDKPVNEIDSHVLDKLRQQSLRYTDSDAMFAKFINDYIFNRN